MSNPAPAIERLTRWFRNDAVPLWARAAWDETHGGFFEALDLGGMPIRSARRVRVQARQIYTFTMLSSEGWHTGAETLAAKGFEYLMSRACPDEGAKGCVHILADDGAVTDDSRDLYDQAFLLLACAARIKAAGCDRARMLAERTISFLESELASPKGGWFENDQRSLPRRQNPHMHLFEAFIALHDATGDVRYFDLASRLINQCFPLFFDADEGAVIEFFDADLTPDPSRPEIEPGHMFEWVWLLRQFEKHAETNFSATRETLYSRGEYFGIDPHFHGFVSNIVKIGAPKPRASKRLWPQTEYLRASCVQACLGDHHARDMIANLIEAMFASYLNTETPGLWIDEFDAQGAPIAADVPASILYHIYEAVTECLRYVEGKPEP